MKIVFEIYYTDVVNLLCVAAVQDDDLLKLAPNKEQIKDLCKRMIRDHGLYRDNWRDGLPDFEEILITGWAVENARRYTW